MQYSSDSTDMERNPGVAWVPFFLCGALVMANVVANEIREGRVVLIYENGLEKWADTGHIIKPPVDTQITSATASEYHRARKEQRRAVARAAANGAVSKKQFIELYGEDAFIAATVDSAMVKAQNAKDPKQIEASRYVMEQTGVSIESGNRSGDDPGDKKSRILLLIAELSRRDDLEKVIEGKASNVDE